MNSYLLIADAQTPAATETQTVQGQPAATPQEQPQSGSGWLQMLPLLLIFVVFMFIMSRSQKKQQQRRVEALSKIMKGDRVTTNSGIYGTVTEVKEDSFMVEISPKVVVEIAKSGVAAAIAPQDAAKCCDPKNLDTKTLDSTKTEK